MRDFIPSVESGQQLVVRFGVGENEVASRLLMNQPISPALRLKFMSAAGVWPPSSRQIEVFVQEYLDGLRTSTAVGTWEELHSAPWMKVIESLDLGPKLFPAWHLDPISHFTKGLEAEFSWLKQMDGKSILVVHPMTSSIERQSQFLRGMHRGFTFEPAKILTYRPPQTNGLNFRWATFEQLLWRAKMDLEELVSTHRPEFALVAAGAYGVPLATHLFRQGLSVYHMGGCLQLLFGVMGNRWRNSGQVLQRATHRWLDRPIEQPPRGSKLIEGSTYW